MVLETKIMENYNLIFRESISSYNQKISDINCSKEYIISALLYFTKNNYFYNEAWNHPNFAEEDKVEFMLKYG